ncbi:MAG TPA: hypothetical protein PKY83_05470 [Bacteroidales bacterium]|jgi:hypothetical protein|nr:hypothetical protein [Bacteroidales bacterium]OQC56063.1 MAG: hypothetical protein BWX52_01864 [Bacteroidetes bacterium ADurb.Bin013]MBV6456214.1 hypothetical protein [Bacteroidales bacterium]MCZ2316763.1 hypothetical protein [Bacteroidales bacterium]NLZ09525.1 hypothetical protein [Bacteroidales bacterium]
MKGIYFWTLAVIITLAAVFLQRNTGPSHPGKEVMEVNGSFFKASFPRSLIRPRDNASNTKLTIELSSTDNAQDRIFGAILYYRQYPGSGNYSAIVPVFATAKDKLLVNCMIPVQPTAGKISYYLQLLGKDGTTVNSQETIMRFRDYVPTPVLMLHILLIFFAFLFSNFTGIYSFADHSRINRFALVTILILFAGGFILGPMVQKYAFGVWWSGWPLGGDITDNKTLIAFLAWVIAYILNKIPFSSPRFCRWRRYFYLAAALITIVAYSIPHSTGGSEYDYQTGTIVTDQVIPREPSNTNQ